MGLDSRARCALDEAMIDEGPSPEDLARFSDESGHCPFCGAEVWDQADVCPKCRNYIGGDTLSTHPTERWFRGKSQVLVILAVLLGLLAYLWIQLV